MPVVAKWLRKVAPWIIFLVYFPCSFHRWRGGSCFYVNVVFFKLLKYHCFYTASCWLNQEFESIGLTREWCGRSEWAWLSHFPDTYTSLVSLNIACLGSEVSVSALERLVDKCPNLRTLRLNRPVPLDRHANLLRRAPQLVEFYVGCYMADLRSEVFSSLTGAFTSCTELKSLLGFWDVVPAYLPSVYPTCSRLTSLNLSYAIIQCDDLTKLNCQCHNLQKLWVFLILYSLFFFSC